MTNFGNRLTRRSLLVTAVVSITVATTGSAHALTPPSEDDIRRDLAAPGVIEIVFRGRGTLERVEENGVFFDEYKRSVTVRRTGDRPGVVVEVIGDAVYRVIDGRFVFRRMRLAGNRLNGLPNPTVAEIDALLSRLTPLDIDRTAYLMVGEIEKIRLADDPRWEWHTPRSVSFEVVETFTARWTGGAYPGSYVEPTKPGEIFLDRVERIDRWRIYRDTDEGPWLRLVATAHRAGAMIPRKGAPSEPAVRLLSRRVVAEREFAALPRPTRVPPLTP
jgi:hypothetical protein